jgi:hypothetical protein
MYALRGVHYSEPSELLVYACEIRSNSTPQDWRITVGIGLQPCSACSDGKKQLAMQAHCGHQTTTMLCSNGSKAQTTAMLCSSGSQALTLVSPMQALPWA